MQQVQDLALWTLAPAVGLEISVPGILAVITICRRQSIVRRGVGALQDDVHSGSPRVYRGGGGGISTALLRTGCPGAWVMLSMAKHILLARCVAIRGVDGYCVRTEGNVVEL